MLFQAARELKLVKTYKGLFNLDKEVTGEKVEMGASTAIEVADYLVKNNLVIPLLDKVVEELGNDPTAENLDGSILEMKDDPSKIVSPLDSNVKIGSEQIADANEEELGDDAKEVAVKEVE
jgi:hypothetical protein